jgi:hypothetical protein
MKLTFKNSLKLGLSGTLILLVGGMLTMNAGDIASGKGAAKSLMKPNAAVPAAAAVPIACTRCTDKFTTSRDLTARGVNKPLALVAQHQCRGCSTQIETVGTGKAKQNVALHTCASKLAQNRACCTRNQ